MLDGWMVGWSVGLDTNFKKVSTHTRNVARRRATSYDVARLLLMVPLEPWRNSTPVFGAAAFCTTKNDDFRASLTLPLRLLMWPRSKVSDVTRRLH